MSRDPQVFQLMIYGETYALRSADSPEYVHRVAQYVDGKFYEIAKGSPSLSGAKMGVLTSLNIADELFRAEARWREANAEAEAKVAHLVALLEDGLAGRAPAAQASGRLTEPRS